MHGRCKPEWQINAGLYVGNDKEAVLGANPLKIVKRKAYNI
jgi:hypothetical protein